MNKNICTGVVRSFNYRHGYGCVTVTGSGPNDPTVFIRQANVAVVTAGERFGESPKFKSEWHKFPSVDDKVVLMLGKPDKRGPQAYIWGPMPQSMKHPKWFRIMQGCTHADGTTDEPEFFPQPLTLDELNAEIEFGGIKFHPYQPAKLFVKTQQIQRCTDEVMGIWEIVNWETTLSVKAVATIKPYVQKPAEAVPTETPVAA